MTGLLLPPLLPLLLSMLLRAAARTAAAVAATAAALHAAAASATITRELNRVGHSGAYGTWSVNSAAIGAASSADTACSVTIAASLANIPSNIGCTLISLKAL